MAKSKKADSKKDEPVEDIPEELAEDIQDAVAAEDGPSKALRTKQIPITHWEEDPIDDEEGIEVAVAAAEDEEVVKEEAAEEPADDIEDADDEEPDEVEEESENEEIDEEADDEPEEVSEDSEEPADDEPEDVDDEDSDDESEDDDSTDDEHEWHLIDEDASEDTEADEDQPATEEASTQELEDEEEIERPEWDEETYKSKIQEDDEETERPEWDEESWQKANLDEEEIERPEWDEEKWKQASSEEDEPERIEVKSEKQVETDVEEAEPEANEQPHEEKTAVERSSKDEVEDNNKEELSASQVALNGEDDEEEKEKKASRRSLAAMPKLLLKWWGRAKVRNTMFATMAILLLLIVTVPTPRYAVLNTVGVRATASLTVLDSETQLPLRQVNVALAGQTALTNESGKVIFDDVKLGSQSLTITKSAYDTYTHSVTIGIGENNFEAVELVSIGTSFEFEVRDWLTSSPIGSAEVVYESNSAFVNTEGVAKLNVAEVGDTKITVTAKAPGYIDQQIEIDTTSQEINEVEMVVDRYHLFVSKRDGRYDIYKIRPDGSDEERVLEGTGNERADIRFDASPSGEKAIIAATRDSGIKNEDGFVLTGLYLIDVGSGAIEKIDSSERIDIVGWIGETVVYVKVQAGSSGQNPERHRLVSFNTQTNKLQQIAASNFFNDVLVADNHIFYAPSDAYKQNPKAYLFRSNATGSNIETVFEKTVWTVFRSGLDEIVFDSEQVWYQGEIDRIFNVELESRPTNTTSRLYTHNPSQTKAAWVDTRDGQGTLIIADVATGEETTLTAQGGLRNPIVWLNDSHLVYRVVTSTETADYVISVAGGDAEKISNVTNVSGADRWYYYY